MKIEHRLRSELPALADALLAADTAAATPVVTFPEPAGRSGRSRLLAVAAALFLVAGLVGLAAVFIDGDENDGRLDISNTTTTTADTTSPTTQAPPSTSQPTDLRGSSAPLPALSWRSAPTAGLPIAPNTGRLGSFGDQPFAVAVRDGLLVALDYVDERRSVVGLLRSVDGITWDPVDDIRLGDLSPTWSPFGDGDEFPAGGTSAFYATSIGSADGAFHIVEQTKGDALHPRVRIWRTTDLLGWTVHEIDSATAEPGLAPDVEVSVVLDVVVEESPATMVASLAYHYSLDWWQFAPADVEWDAEAELAYLSQFPFHDPPNADDPVGFAETDGIRFSYDENAPVVPWGQMRPSALETHLWWTGPGRNGTTIGELYVLSPDGSIAAAPTWPFDDPGDRWAYTQISWSGTRFVANVQEHGFAASEDGSEWRLVPPREDFRQGLGGVRDALVIIDRNADNALLFSLDDGRSFTRANVDAPYEVFVDFWTFRPPEGSPATVIARDPTDGTWLVMRSINGSDWTTSPIDRDITGDPRLVIATPDNTVYVFGEDGVEIGRPTD